MSLFRRTRCLALLSLLFVTAARVMAASVGPTLQFDYGHNTLPPNPVADFMYFVPLVSPDAVSIVTNAGNTQAARVGSFSCQTNGSAFTAACDFEFIGAGRLQNIFDHTGRIKKCENLLAAGETLTHQLDSINVEGAGSGRVEITGTLANGVSTVTEVKLQFNNHGHASPVSIDLVDISRHDGKLRFDNAVTARVNTLVFQRKPGQPKMEVTLASVKNKDAGDGAWANLVGSIKGAAANLFLPPLSIEADGQQAMLDFGLALTMEKPAFTFPLATRLKTAGAPGP
ncbi:MAG TPA: hypothetical protein VG347_21365 [Verrucomicrobiae bacterium]|nr:hypothetical protein [Verrucomicrobiae bacterium]